ncbi:MAG: hypothetical protein ACI81R_001484 [Bradymonadia bacterium]|jgi:hypothetical protein
MILFTRRITYPTTIVRLFACLLGAVTFLTLSSGAWAFSPITVLAIDGQDDEGEGVSPSLYNTVRTQVALHPDFSLSDVPPQALQDLLLAAGCSTLDDACASDLASLLGSRWVLWGFADAAGVTLHLRDLTGEEPQRSTRLDHVPTTAREEVLLARRLLWGDIGVLAVSSSPPGAQVFIDGRLVGTTPLRLQSQAPGLVTLRLVSPTHAIFERVVEIDINESIVAATLAPMVAAAPPRDRTITAPAAYLTASTALLVAGISTAISVTRTQNRFDDVMGNPSLDRGRAGTLETRGNRRATASNALIPLGSIGTIGSTVWLLLRRDQRGHDDVMTDSGAWSRYHGTALQSGTSNESRVAE